jgi:hypothetical protein
LANRPLNWLSSSFLAPPIINLSRSCNLDPPRARHRESSFGHHHACFGYRTANADKGDPNPFADGVAVTKWNGKGPTATYKLLQPPHRPGTPAPPPPARMQRQPGTLRPGQYLLPGQSIGSPNGMYRLVYREDNLLVQLGPPGLMWRTPGAPGDAGICFLQSDGNLVIYDQHGHATWATATRGTDNILRMDDNGSVGLYTGNGVRIWSNNP